MQVRFSRWCDGAEQLGWGQRADQSRIHTHIHTLHNPLTAAYFWLTI